MSKLSIALCTYNGERYLSGQLESISRQTRPPDELVICDDRSSDGTLEIIGQFTGRAAFPVRLIVNEANLGSTKNFEKAIRSCTGDIIFLCDQDDVWCRDKLETVEAVFDRFPGVGLVFSDAWLIDGDGKPIGKKLWDTVRFSKSRQRRMSRGDYPGVLLKRNVVTGATMAFRSSCRQYLLPIPEQAVHDTWIALLMSGRTSLRKLDHPLIRYRVHAGQQIGVTLDVPGYASNKLYDVYRNPHDHHIAGIESERKTYEEACRRLFRGPDGLYSMRIREKTGHAEARLKAISRGGAAGFIMLSREIARLRYFRYSDGFNDVLLDVISLLRMRRLS